MQKKVVFKTVTFLIISAFFLSCDKGGTEETFDKGKVKWLKDAFLTIVSDNDIKAISYWNENWEDVKPVKMIINSSQGSLNTYQQNIANEHFKTVPNIVNGKLKEPVTGAYHCAYPGFAINNGADEVVTAKKIQNFVSNAQKDIAWVYFSNGWHKGILFPKDEVKIIDGEGKIPFIRMMPWSVVAPHLTQADPAFSMQKFINGDFDDDLKKWAQDLIKFGKPTIIEFGPEVDGNYMPWNGQWNGKDETSYGNNSVPDGAERYRDAYKHIIDLFNNQGVTNATWVFHVNYSPVPEEEWNKMKYYYPGDAYIDWIGVSIYGPLFKNQEWTNSFSEVWDYVKPKLQELSAKKPIAILEFGVGEH